MDKGRPTRTRRAGLYARIFQLICVEHLKNPSNCLVTRDDVRKLFPKGCRAEAVQRALDKIVELAELIKLGPDGIQAAPRSYYQLHAMENRPFKDAVARKVAEIIPTGTSLACTEGSTVAMCVREILARRKHVAIATNNCAIVQQNFEDIEIHFSGGQFDPSSYSCTGPEAAEYFREYKCRTCLMGVSGIDGDGKLYVYHAADCRVRSVALEFTTDSVIIAADATKLLRRDPWHVADIQQLLDRLQVTLVTNSPDVLRGQERKRQHARHVLEQLKEKLPALRIVCAESGEFQLDGRGVPELSAPAELDAATHGDEDAYAHPDQPR
jgi:hypothetical protein